jgi:hypothetical protein
MRRNCICNLSNYELHIFECANAMDVNCGLSARVWGTNLAYKMRGSVLYAG